MKKAIWLILLLGLFFSCTPKVKPLPSTKIAKKTKYIIKPIPFNPDTSYSQLITMDKNKDGVINGLDYNKQKIYPNYEAIFADYLIYLNRYQKADKAYANFLEKDINKNNIIDNFEKKIINLKRQGDFLEAIALLNKLRWQNKLSTKLFYSAIYSIYNYAGYYEMVKKTEKEAGLALPNSNFAILANISKKPFKYRDGRYESKFILQNFLYNSYNKIMHNHPKSRELIAKDANSIFPYLFSDSTFMITLVMVIQIKDEKDIVQLSQIKKSSPSIARKIRKKIEEHKQSFNDYDVFYAYLTTTLGNDHYNKHRTKLFAKKIDAIIKTKNISIKSFNSGVSFLKTFFADNKINPGDYHYALSGLLSLLISNKKPYNESDLLFSPNTLLQKGYGVCADTSPAISMFLSKFGKKRYASLYFWYRKHFYQHLRMIYQNNDGRFYIFDNYGIARFSFKTLNEAIAYNCIYAYKYMDGKVSTKCDTQNKSWDNIEFNRTNKIKSSDNSITITFGAKKPAISHKY